MQNLLQEFKEDLRANNEESQRLKKMEMEIEEDLQGNRARLERVEKMFRTIGNTEDQRQIEERLNSLEDLVKYQKLRIDDQKFMLELSQGLGSFLVALMSLGSCLFPKVIAAYRRDNKAVDLAN